MASTPGTSLLSLPSNDVQKSWYEGVSKTRGFPDRVMSAYSEGSAKRIRWTKGMLDAREGGNGGNLDWGLLVDDGDDDDDDVISSVLILFEGKSKTSAIWRFKSQRKMKHSKQMDVRLVEL